MAPGSPLCSASKSGLDHASALATGLATAAGLPGDPAPGFAAAETPAGAGGGVPGDGGVDLGAGASACAGGITPLVPGEGFCASPPLPALGGVFGSSVISVQACREAPFYTQQKNRFLHIADKHVNRESRPEQAWWASLSATSDNRPACSQTLHVGAGIGPWHPAASLFAHVQRTSAARPFINRLDYIRVARNQELRNDVRAYTLRSANQEFAPSLRYPASNLKLIR